MNDSYQATLDYLYSFTNFEHRRIDQYAPENVDPTRPGRLLALLGEPHRQFPSLHIAGTKGKGSVAAMCAAALRAAGLKAGLYTSPHLTEFRDRIRVLTPADANGRIPQAEVVALVNKIKSVVAEVPGITWFELVTALAFLHFAGQKVDVAVVEVGLGGRLDATNILTPLVSVITSLSLDHTELLGETLVEIAGEKGGIIKPGVPVVTAPQAPEALARLSEIAGEKGAPLIVAGRDWTYETLESRPESQTIIVYPPSAAGGQRPAVSRQTSIIKIPLAGRHQQENAVVALAALHLIAPHLCGLTSRAIEEGLATVQWPGRLQILHQGFGSPTIVVDAAHNADSAAKLAAALQEVYNYRRLWLVLGVTADKDVAGILQPLLPLAEGIVLTRSSHPRAATLDELHRLTLTLGYEAQTCPAVVEAVKRACQLAGPDDLVCVTGSIFIVGDLLNQWEGLQSRK